MALPRSRQHGINETPYAHEQEGIAYAIKALPDADPYQLWALAELLDPGSGHLHEIDLIIIGHSAIYLVELKAHPGRITGDSVDWWWYPPEGGRRYLEPPLRRTNLKAKILKGLLRRHMHKDNPVPRVEALVFMSAAKLKLDLDESGRVGVVTRATFLKAITDHEFYGAQPGWHGRRIGHTVMRDVAKALGKMGIRPRAGKLHAGSYALGEVLAEGVGYQERQAVHRHNEKICGRARTYLVPEQSDPERRQRLYRAAQRESQLLYDVREHGNVLRITDYVTDAPLGPTVIFDDFDGGVALEAFLRAESELPFDERVELIAQVGRALAHCHKSGVMHGALGPDAVLVRRHPTGGGIDTRLYNFQLGQSSAVQGTSHWSALSSDPAALYRAPELAESPRPTVQSDLYSLGALAHLVFTGRPPGDDPVAIFKRLSRDGHLDPQLVLSHPMQAEVAEAICEATLRTPVERLDSVEDWVEYFEDAATAPDEEVLEEIDPLTAKVGQVLGDELRVLGRLGQGASSRVLKVESIADDRPYALKVSLSPEHDERLEREAEGLLGLEHARIVRCYGVRKFKGRTCLLLSVAGDSTLHKLLLKEGTVSLDLMARYGTDLLDALQHLEEVALVHRDIKPANLGVGAAGKRAKHLTLFDFSLLDVPLSCLNVGTSPYRDPFLAGRGKWDAAADRWGAAITLHEMLSGICPSYAGAALDPEAKLKVAAERFDAAVRPALARFFKRALHRDVAQRFASAEKMRAAWNACFIEPSRSAHPPGVSSHPPGGSVRPAAGSMPPPGVSSLPPGGSVRPAAGSMPAPAGSTHSADAPSPPPSHPPRVEAEEIRAESGAAHEGLAPESLAPESLVPESAADARLLAPLSLSSEQLAQLSPDTPIGRLGLSARAENVLDRAGVLRLRELAFLPANGLTAIRGVGSEVSKEVHALRESWRQAQQAAPLVREPFFKNYHGADRPLEELALAPTVLAILADAGIHSLAALASSPAPQLAALAERHELPLADLRKQLSEADRAVDQGQRPATLEAWVQAFFGGRSKAMGHVKCLFGLEPPFVGRLDVRASEVASAAQTGVQAIYLALGKAREAWDEHAAFDALLQLVHSVSDGLGGGAPLLEAAEAVVQRMPHDGAIATSLCNARAAALIRIVIEVEKDEIDGLRSVRFGAGDPWVVMSQQHGALIRRLAANADLLAGRDVLLAPSAAMASFQRLAELGQALGSLAALAPERLAQLGAKASEKAACSPRGDIYPRGMAPSRALELVHSANVIKAGVTPEKLQRELAARFPEAAPLPPRPALDALLAAFKLSWVEKSQSYGRPSESAMATAATASASGTRLSQISTGHRRRKRDHEAIGRAEFEERLDIAIERRALRVLGVRANHAQAAAQRLSAYLQVPEVALDQRLIAAMERCGAQKNVPANAMHQADLRGPSGKRWSMLMKLVHDAAGELVAELLPAKQPLLLTNPGLLARYGLSHVIDALVRSAAEDDDARAIFLLVPAHDVGGVPRINAQLPIRGVLEADAFWVPSRWIHHLDKPAA